jgi:hypothetical protein
MALTVHCNDSANCWNVPADEGRKFQDFAKARGWAKLFVRSFLVLLAAGCWHGDLRPSLEIFAWIKISEIANWEWIGPSRAGIF